MVNEEPGPAQGWEELIKLLVRKTCTCYKEYDNRTHHLSFPPG